MLSFDFIVSPEFRSALEADHAEMLRCVDALAWKSVHVLAGSIVEALLIDYLAATTHSGRSTKDPLKIDLAQAVIICRQESVISDRTADLCAVIRSYRNLIHPGRAVRQEETPPTRDTAAIAVSLVTLIVGEVAKRRRAAFGLTAEQIVSKVEHDNNAIGILRHLLADVNEYHRGRLLELIPEQYFSYVTEQPFGDLEETPTRFKRAYRIVFESATDKDREGACKKFVTILREADGEYVTQYRDAFFLPSDLEWVDVAQRGLVLQHFVTTTAPPLSDGDARRLAALAPYLPTADTAAWIDLFVRTLTVGTSDDQDRHRVRERLIRGTIDASAEVLLAIDKRLVVWIDAFRERGQADEADRISGLRTAIDDAQLPF